jgi:hypothetical protein
MPADFRPSWHKRLKGEWHLVRMVVRAAEKRDNWLLIKSHDEYANQKNGVGHLSTIPKAQLPGVA